MVSIYKLCLQAEIICCFWYNLVWIGKVIRFSLTWWRHSEYMVFIWNLTLCSGLSLGRDAPLVAPNKSTSVSSLRILCTHFLNRSIADKSSESLEWEPSSSQHLPEPIALLLQPSCVHPNFWEGTALPDTAELRASSLVLFCASKLWALPVWVWWIPFLIPATVKAVRKEQLVMPRFFEACPWFGLGVVCGPL